MHAHGLLFRIQLIKALTSVCINRDLRSFEIRIRIGRPDLNSIQK